MNYFVVMNMPYCWIVNLLPYLAQTMQLALYFGINILVVILLLKYVYKQSYKNPEHIFTYYTLNILLFFICYAMANLNLGVSFGFGLFALFSIIRYRTDTIEIKEMTYLFAVVCIAILNALSNNETIHYSQLIFINVAILTTIYVLERKFFGNAVKSCYMVYEKIQLIHQQQKSELKKDLVERTGLNIVNIDVKKVNFLNDTVELTVYYRDNN